MLFQLLWFSEQKHFHIICRCNGRHLGFVISQSNSCTEWRMGQYSKHKYPSICFVVFNFSCQHGKTVGSIKNCIFAPSVGEEMASRFQKAPKNVFFPHVYMISWMLLQTNKHMWHAVGFALLLTYLSSPCRSQLGLLRTVVDSSFLLKAIPLEETTCPQCFIKGDIFSPRIACWRGLLMWIKRNIAAKENHKLTQSISGRFCSPYLRFICDQFYV